MSGLQPDVTELLHRWSTGDAGCLDQLLDASYAQLRRSARGMMRGERPNHTLQATELVHEAFLRFCHGGPIDEASRDAFFRLMAAQMRRHLIDHARRRSALKRGGAQPHADVPDVADIAASSPPEETGEVYLARLDAALEQLGLIHPRVAQVIQERFFADRTIEETAHAMGLSPGTVKSEFAFGRAWLMQAMGSATVRA